MCAYPNHPNTTGEAWYSYWLKAHYTFGDEVHCLCLTVQSPMFNYHLVRCRIVEDLIDSPHLSQDCTKGQQVTQHVHPGVQLHGKSRVQWWEYHSSMTAKYCSCILVLPAHSSKVLLLSTKSKPLNYYVFFSQCSEHGLPSRRLSKAVEYKRRDTSAESQ